MMSNFGIGSLACYCNLEQIGEGTYGYVYKAKDKTNHETVALKRLLLHKDSYGFPLCAIREIKFLKSLQHKNIVLLKDIISSKGCEELEKYVKTESNRSNITENETKPENETDKKDNIEKDILRICGNLYLVFEYVEHDLGGLIDMKYKFSMREIKCIMKQLIEVLDYLSEKKILHRDIKSSNILLSNRHHVKLADFGLARSIQSADGRDIRSDLTNNVITLWYKPPELLLGSVRYSTSVDIWSVGCVLAELELGRPLFPGRTDIEQFDIICRALGTPSESIWTGVEKLPYFDSILGNTTKYHQSLRSTYGGKLSEHTIDFLERILVFDPTRRSSAKILSTNKYFLIQPLPPLDPRELDPIDGSYHEYLTKHLKRQREKEQPVISSSSDAAIIGTISTTNTTTNTTISTSSYKQQQLLPPTYSSSTATTINTGHGIHNNSTTTTSMATNIGYKR